MYQAVLEVKNTIFDFLQILLVSYAEELEGSAYSACDFLINGKSIKFRSSKVTPKKIGQFVTLWKRDVNGGTIPYHEDDEFQFVMIFAKQKAKKGVFIFPKALLIAQKIISSRNKEGKRGFRIYPPWDKAVNKQAMHSQRWQLAYFIALEDDVPTTRDLLEKLVC